MKKLLLVSLLSCAALSSNAGQVASDCYVAADGVNWGCMFEIPQNSNAQTYAYYYCAVVPDDPNNESSVGVQMFDHNVQISGFQGSGEVSFGEGGVYPLSTLNSVYFEAINDTMHDGAYKGVDITVKGGKLYCANGTGGRSNVLGGFGLVPKK